MKTITIDNGKEKMLLSNLYEWTLKQLESGLFTENQEKKVLENLKDLEWIHPMLTDISQEERQRLYENTLIEMRKGTYPPFPMGWSAMCFNFSLYGINTDEMKHVINHSKVLRNEVEITLNDDYGN